ncbi:MAG: hypothetical protein ACYC54_07785 [Sedimentisphaerales bacterium]
MKKLLCLCGFLVVLVLPMASRACLIEYSVTVTANNGTGLDVKTFSGNGETDENGYFQCSLVNSEQAIGDSAIDFLKLKINSDPEVGIEFGVRAGGLTTTFQIISAVVAFSSLVNPTADASAGVTLTDRLSGTGAAAGATITGLFDGGKVHQARYNTSTVFANLVSGFSIPTGTLTDEEAKPVSGSETINDTLTSIESEFYFTLSARDAASGTSNFIVIPEPATIAILSIGALSLLRIKK